MPKYNYTHVALKGLRVRFNCDMPLQAIVSPINALNFEAGATVECKIIDEQDNVIGTCDFGVKGFPPRLGVNVNDADTFAALKDYNAGQLDMTSAKPKRVAVGDPADWLKPATVLSSGSKPMSPSQAHKAAQAALKRK